METHAHHLHKAPSHGWRHYLFEFLMLFLAVFCGFLAENQRERLVERNRAKEYAEGLVTDLQIDIGELQRGIRETKFLIAAIDSVIAISTQWESQPVIPGSFYYYSRFVSFTYRVDWSRSTIDQLVQSGNLRYFKDKHLVEGINYYYYQGGFMGTEYQRDLLSMDKVTEARNRILLSRYYTPFTEMTLVNESQQHTPSRQIDSLKAVLLPLQQDAVKRMNEYINYLSDRRKRLAVSAEIYYPQGVGVAEDLIKLLSNEYHLKSKT